MTEGPTRAVEVTLPLTAPGQISQPGTLFDQNRPHDR